MKMCGEAWLKHGDPWKHDRRVQAEMPSGISSKRNAGRQKNAPRYRGEIHRKPEEERGIQRKAES